MGGYDGKLDVPYKTSDDEYALFLSVNGTQFYLYVTQTMIANALMVRSTRIEYILWYNLTMFIVTRFIFST